MFKKLDAAVSIFCITSTFDTIASTACAKCRPSHCNPKGCVWDGIVSDGANEKYAVTYGISTVIGCIPQRSMDTNVDVD